MQNISPTCINANDSLWTGRQAGRQTYYTCRGNAGRLTITKVSEFESFSLRKRGMRETLGDARNNKKMKEK